MKEEIERLKEHILNYDVCKNLYNNRKIIKLIKEKVVNIYQKKLNKLVSYSIKYYEHIWKERESFRWHRYREKLSLKECREDNLMGLEKNLKSAIDLCKQDELI
ncbi:hypothetical protein DVV91_10105 [Clostridium botulinum]|uniref:hypothetical protein n=1 Tax=Clostridium botulinum TaxID=1491 RepID=UPI0019670E09|nr:hypothetical protein [Clostridium botulinum]MBN1074694.1 hypothetical protein [Clostridium botulinum]